MVQGNEGKDFKLITKIEIPRYIRQIRLSDKQNPIYYEYDINFGRFKVRGNRKIRKSFVRSMDRLLQDGGDLTLYNFNFDKYKVGIFINGKLRGELIYNPGKSNNIEHKYYKITSSLKQRIRYIVCDRENNTKIIANIKSVGKPKIQTIRGQDIYSGGAGFEFIRATIVSKLKEFYEPYIKFLPEIKSFPIYIFYEVIDTVRNDLDNHKDGVGTRWDVGNRVFPYMKSFSDCLEDNGIIPDDERLYVTGDGSIFTPLPEHTPDKAKLIVYIYQDKRKEIITNQFYKEKHNDFI